MYNMRVLFRVLTWAVRHHAKCSVVEILHSWGSCTASFTSRIDPDLPKLYEFFVFVTISFSLFTNVFSMRYVKKKHTPFFFCGCNKIPVAKWLVHDKDRSLILDHSSGVWQI